MTSLLQSSESSQECPTSLTQVTCHTASQPCSLWTLDIIRIPQKGKEWSPNWHMATTSEVGASVLTGKIKANKKHSTGIIQSWSERGLVSHPRGFLGLAKQAYTARKRRNHSRQRDHGGERVPACLMTKNKNTDFIFSIFLEVG